LANASLEWKQRQFRSGVFLMEPLARHNRVFFYLPQVPFESLQPDSYGARRLVTASL
jgi:hypothetical protein